MQSLPFEPDPESSAVGTGRRTAGPGAKWWLAVSLVGGLLAAPPCASASRPDAAPAIRAWLAGDAAAALEACQPQAGGSDERQRRLNRAVLLLYLGRGEDAEPILLDLRRQDEHFLPALRWLARARHELGRPEAAETISRLLAHRGLDSRDLLWAAQVLVSRGEIAPARDAFARAVHEDPELYLGWLGLGDSEAALDHPVAARSAWRSALGLHEGGGVLFRLGRALWDSGDRARALPLLERVLVSSEASTYRDPILAMEPSLADRVPLATPGSLWLHPGERLRFRCRFLFLDLSTLVIENRGRLMYRGRWVNRLNVRVRSESFFLKMDSEFENLVTDDGVLLSHRSVGDDSASGGHAASYEMDPERRTCVVRYVSDGYLGYDHLPLPPGAQDVLSVLQLAREVARTRRPVSVLTAVDNTWKGTRIWALGRERIKWNDQSVDAVRVESVAHYRGAAGVSGAMSFWVSADEQAIPYRARLKAAIGSVVLELLPEPPLTANGRLGPP